MKFRWRSLWSFVREINTVSGLGKYDAIHKNDDIANDSLIFEKMETRMKVAQTDEGYELQARVEDLLDLLEAFRSGAVTENHKD